MEQKKRACIARAGFAIEDLEAVDIGGEVFDAAHDVLLGPSVTRCNGARRL